MTAAYQELGFESAFTHWSPIVRTMARKPLIQALKQGQDAIRPRDIQRLTKEALADAVRSVLRAGGEEADRMAAALDLAYRDAVSTLTARRTGKAF